MTADTDQVPTTASRDADRGRMTVPILGWTALVGLATFLGLHGRLIGDDYCSASRAVELGLLGGAWNLFTTWHSGWSYDLATVAFGLLTVHLPVRVSYLPFAFTTLGLVLLCARAIAVALGVSGPGATRLLWRRHVPTISVVLLVGFAATMRNQDLLYATFLWQTASVPHVWSVLLSVILMVATWECRQSARQATTAWLLLATAFVAGFGLSETATLAASAAGLGIAAVAASRHVTDSAMTRRTGLRYLGVSIVATVSFCLMFLAPGTQARREFLQVPERDLLGKLAFYQELVGDLLASSLGRHGVIVAFVVGMAMAAMVSRNASRQFRPVRSAGVSVAFGATATVGVLLTAAGDIASYTAYWHTLHLIVLWCAAALAAGLTIGGVLVGELRNRGAGPVTSGALGLVCSAMLILLFHTAWYAEPILDRVATWDSGNPSAFAGIEDRDSPWVRECWNVLRRAGVQ